MLVCSWRQMQNTRRAHQLAVAGVLNSRHKINTIAAIEPGMRRVRFSPMALKMLVYSCFPSPEKTVFNSPWSEIFRNLLREHHFLIRGGLLKSFVREPIGPSPLNYIEVQVELLAEVDDIERTRDCIKLLFVEAFHTYMLQLAATWLGKLDRRVAVQIAVLYALPIIVSKTLRARYVTHDEHPPPPEPLALNPTIRPNAPAA